MTMAVGLRSITIFDGNNPVVARIRIHKDTNGVVLLASFYLGKNQTMYLLKT